LRNGSRPSFESIVRTYSQAPHQPTEGRDRAVRSSSNRSGRQKLIPRDRRSAWHFEGTRKTRKGTAAGGKKKQGAAVTGWSAEIFIPYELLKPLKNVPPKPGTEWRANFYRMDYDAGKHTMWTWQPIDTSFHEYRKFGTLVFE
jgi:hypothetical protein